MDPDELAGGPAHGFRMLVYAADLWIYQQALRRCFRTSARPRHGGGRHAVIAGAPSATTARRVRPPGAGPARPGR